MDVLRKRLLNCVLEYTSFCIGQLVINHCCKWPSEVKMIYEPSFLIFLCWTPSGLGRSKDALGCRVNEISFGYLVLCNLLRKLQVARNFIVILINSVQFPIAFYSEEIYLSMVAKCESQNLSHILFYNLCSWFCMFADLLWFWHTFECLCL